MIGVWTTASRQRVHFNFESRNDWNNPANVGPWTQVSRLGNPLFNEVLVPMERKDDWNSDSPFDDSQYADGVLHPELAKLLPVLYPGAFPNLAALVASGKPRADLAAILLTGIPAGVVSPNFQNFTGTDAGRPAAAEHGDPAIEHAEQPRSGRRRPRRLPERPPHRRRRGDDRAEGDRGRDLPAHRPDLHARHGGRARSTRASRAAPPTRRPRAPRTTCRRSRTSATRTAASKCRRHEHSPSRSRPRPRTGTAPPKARLPPSRQGTVVLDIGDGVGALVVHTPGELCGVEIEIARRGEQDAFVHTEVRERVLPEGSVYAGVFVALDEGDYTLLDVDGHLAARRIHRVRSRHRSRALTLGSAELHARRQLIGSGALQLVERGPSPTDRHDE